MPLQFIRSKVSTGFDPLQAAISTTALAKDLLSTLQFPPAIAAVSIVLLILETVQVSMTLCTVVRFGATEIMFYNLQLCAGYTGESSWLYCPSAASDTGIGRYRSSNAGKMGLCTRTPGAKPAEIRGVGLDSYLDMYFRL